MLGLRCGRGRGGRLLLGRCGLLLLGLRGRLRLLGGLFLLLGGLLFLSAGLLGSSGLLGAALRSGTGFYGSEVLADGNGILLTDKELLQGTGLGCVDSDIDLGRVLASRPSLAERCPGSFTHLVGLDSRDLLILLDVVTNLLGELF